jgi:hypothetical protein
MHVRPPGTLRPHRDPDHPQSIIEVVRELRKGKARTGLVLANGGVMTHQHVVCLSSRPRKDHSPYPAKNPLPARTTDWYVPPIATQAEGEATIEVSSRALRSNEY